MFFLRNFWTFASFFLHNCLLSVLMNNHTFLLFVYHILLCFFCNINIFFSNYLLLFMMFLQRLMNLMYFSPVYNRLNNLMIDWNVMLVYDMLMSLDYDFFVVLMNYVLRINFPDLGLLRHFLNYSYYFVFVLVVILVCILLLKLLLLVVNTLYCLFLESLICLNESFARTDSSILSASCTNKVVLSIYVFLLNIIHMI